MDASRLLYPHLRKTCPAIHATRLAALLAAVRTLTHHPRLTLTELGRALRSPALVKHNIKRMDRLLGNARLAAERPMIFTALVHWLLARVAQPIVLVDWSHLTADQQWHVLRASLPLGGRALTLYEEVHPRCALASERVHGAFLAQLGHILPPGVRPIVVTDAGFRGTWFRLVEARDGTGLAAFAIGHWFNVQGRTHGCPARRSTLRPRPFPPRLGPSTWSARTR